MTIDVDAKLDFAPVGQTSVKGQMSAKMLILVFTDEIYAVCCYKQI